MVRPTARSVDSRDHVRVPPAHPSYDIRRIWLSPEEESGFYYGFSNEGLWPLCHNAHVRPTFRTGRLGAVRRRQRTVCSGRVEEAKTDDPVVLVQDYHFALLPKMVREKLPNATIIMFWHIPWPNAESYGICPWRQEILEGLLGSSIVGFHTREHGNHFLYCIDRILEARIDRTLPRCPTADVSQRSIPIPSRLSGLRAGWRINGRCPSAGRISASVMPWGLIDLWGSAWTGSTIPRASSSGSSRLNDCSSCSLSGWENFPSFRSPRQAGPLSTSTSTFTIRSMRWRSASTNGSAVKGTNRSC